MSLHLGIKSRRVVPRELHFTAHLQGQFWTRDFHRNVASS